MISALQHIFYVPGQLDLEYHATRICEIIFATNQIKSPHPDKGVIILFWQLAFLRLKACTPMIKGKYIM